jgi:CheY-like chemotaxis protein
MARILVVDDEEGVRALLKRLLGLHNHAVDTVNDGAEAIDQLQRKHYDLMIIDHRMPKITGPEALAVIRSSDKLKTLRVLMLTGVSLIKDVDEAFEMGILGYLIKPINVKKLLEKVEGSLLVCP